MDVLLLEEKVLVKQDEKTIENKSGIILAEEFIERPLTGDVVASSIKGVNLGNKIYFSQYAGLPVVLEGIEYLVLNKKDILLYLK